MDKPYKAPMAFLVAMACLLMAGVSQAAEPDPNDLWLVKSSGTWKEGERYGSYRVMVYRERGGKGEYSLDRVFVDILETQKVENEGEMLYRIVKSNRLELDTSAHRGYIADVSFNNISDQKMAIIFDIWMMAMDNLVLREIFFIAPNGDHERVLEAKWIDTCC